MPSSKHPAISALAFESDGSQDHLITPDMLQISDAELSALLAPAKTAEQIQSEIVQATQCRLDDFAQSRNYDSILSAATYATSSVQKFAVEGQIAVDLRDATWAALYTLFADVEAGTIPMPTDSTDVEPLLPALTWPA